MLGRVALWGPEFAADPHAVYARLRDYGACAPVELAPGVNATLVTSYRAALDVLHDTETYSKDPRVWQHTIPADSQILPMMMWRPNALFNDDETHARYRQAISDSLSLIEPHELRDITHRAADTLIRDFAARGEADLIGQYALPLPLLVFNDLFSMPETHGEQFVTAVNRMFDAASPEEAARGNEEITRYLIELVTMKRGRPGQDLASWLIEHPTALNDQEVVDQLVTALSAGYEPVTNLIGNALSRMLSDPRYYRTVSSGALTATDAITDVLWNDPPLANYSVHYPRRDVDLHGTWIPAHTPVVISYAAANTCPADLPPGPRTDYGAHLAFAAGPHACPAKQPAVLIATTAIDRLTGWLCDIHLAVPYDQVAWRPGPFHRALASLPARFTPIAPDQKGTSPWTACPSSSTRQAATSQGRPLASATQDPPSA
ncbi:cytochrome P450 [Streptomyces sp. B6B3]|uniref:cytochrome P450 n=1 Tax=Streptomyces sp. B6B3 TaxID=3153570 RepID=UPI00325D09F4